MKHTSDIPVMWGLIIVMLLSTSCAVAQPPLLAGDVLPMGTGSALMVFQRAVAGAAGTKVIAGPIPGGTGYIFLEAFDNWFGAVLYGTSGKCSDFCLQKLLNVTGNAMTSQTAQELATYATDKLGWKELDPVTLPAWMRIVSGIVRTSYNASQLSTGWIVIVPAGAFQLEPGFVPETVDN